MELRTAEVRWFRAGPCPKSVAAWFHDAPLVGDPERRTDLYLRLPGRGDLGVKQRGGTMLDLKIRTGRRNDVSLPDGFDGRVEQWAKWSFPLEAGQPQPTGNTWTPVAKVRWSRLYEVGAEDGARAVPLDGIVGNGCAAEVVEVRVGGDYSWGFGFEAFGNNLDSVAVLETAAHRFVHDSPLDGLAFDMADSHSYPSWLQVWPEG